MAGVVEEHRVVFCDVETADGINNRLAVEIRAVYFATYDIEPGQCLYILQKRRDVFLVLNDTRPDFAVGGMCHHNGVDGLRHRPVGCAEEKEPTCGKHDHGMKTQ